jgi:hypothetical protein
MNAAPGFELHMTQYSVLGLTNEPLADFNMLILSPDADAEGFLTRSVARAKTRGLPLLAMMSPHVAPRLAPVARGLGLTAAGAAPRCGLSLTTRALTITRRARVRTPFSSRLQALRPFSFAATEAPRPRALKRPVLFPFPANRCGLPPARRMARWTSPTKLGGRTPAQRGPLSRTRPGRTRK